MKHSDSSGFTLLEILLVVAAIAILAGIVIVAINPARQLGETRNAQRRVDVRTILSAIQQYQLNNGEIPGNITGSAESTQCLSVATMEICKTGGNCSGMTDLAVLTNSGTYITQMPIDPQGSPNDVADGTGYSVMQFTSNNRVIVCAPQAELDETISIQQ